MKTIFGLEWPVATSLDVILTLLFFILIGFFFLLYRHYQIIKKRQELLEQNFILKVRQIGLTRSQSQALSDIMALVPEKNRNRLFTDPLLFESALSKHPDVITGADETAEKREARCKNIAVMHEKLYHNTAYQRPLDALSEIADDTAACLSVADAPPLIAKLSGKEGNTLRLTLFGMADAAEIAGKQASFYFFRAGDAEYRFESIISPAEGQIVSTPIPETFTRGTDVRHPYVETDIPCLMTVQPLRNPASAVEPAEEQHEEQIETIGASVTRLNEHEVVVRFARPLAFNRHYTIELEINEFKIRSELRMMSGGSPYETGPHFLTFKFVDLSPIAGDILRKYVAERLG